MKKLPFFISKGFIAFVFGLIFLSISNNQVLAQAGCSLQGCIPDDGYCQHGAVMSCMYENMLCHDGNWLSCEDPGVQCGEETPELCEYGLGAAVNPSYRKFVKSLQTACERGGMDLRAWLGSAENLDPEKCPAGFSTALLNTMYAHMVGVPPEEGYTGSPGAIGTVASLINGIYSHPPASSGEYFAYLGQKLNLVEPAYAQGVGFPGLSPLIGLWKSFRNIAYFVFIIIFILVGFAVMFRIKLDPQTVITVQNALPRIIFTLILITFSYAIAGLLVDLIYLAASLIFTVIGRMKIDIHQNIFGIANQIFGASWWRYRTRQEVVIQIGKVVEEVVEGAPKILGATAGQLAGVIFALALLFSLFRLFFTLLISYVTILIAVIFAPVMIALDAIPGQKGFGNWFRLIFSNIIVFPTMIGVFALAHALKAKIQTAGELWIAPGIGRSTSGLGVDFAAFIVTYGLILAAPTVINNIKKAIGAPGVGAAMAGVMPALRFGAIPIRAIGAGARIGWQRFREYPDIERKTYKEAVARERLIKRGLIKPRP